MKQAIIQALLEADKENVKAIPGIVINPMKCAKDSIEENLTTGELANEIDDTESSILNPLDIIDEVLAFEEWVTQENGKVPVALVKTPGGLEFVVADSDCDGTYDIALTKKGELFSVSFEHGEAIIGKQLRELGITISDLEMIANDSGDYLAPNDYDKKLMDEKHPEGEITDTKG